MNSQEAIQKINEIYGVIEGSNSIFFNAKRMILIGVVVTLIPLIDYLTHDLILSLLSGLTDNLTLISTLNVLFYVGVIKLGSRLLGVRDTVEKSNLHPTVIKTFSLKRPLLFAMGGSALALHSSGQEAMIAPIMLIFFGLIYIIYGKFSSKTVLNFAWSYLILGVTLLYYNKVQIPHLHLAVLLYCGISYTYMGFTLLKEKRSL